MGAGSTISQSLIFREFLVVFYGNELVLSFILFTWLISITIGAWSFNLIEKKIKDAKSFFLKSVFVFSLLPFALIPVIRISRGFLNVDYGLYIPFPRMTLLSFMVIFPPAFLIGITFPLGCRILSGKTAVSRIYVAESVGSLFGGTLFSFVLVRLLPNPAVAALLTLLFSITCFFFYGHSYSPDKFRGKGRIKFNVVRILMILLSLSIALFSFPLDRITVQARWKTLIQKLPLIKNTDSPYQNLALTRQMNQYSVFFNGIYGFSFPDEYSDSTLAHHILTQSPDPQKVLVIGEVTPTFVNECLKQPIRQLTCVYFDPQLFNLIGPYLSKEGKQTLENPAVNFVFSDGRQFVRGYDGKFDLIYLNLPDPSNALINRYYTREFFQLVRGISHKKTVLALSLTSSENYMGRQITNYNASIYKTLKTVFPYVDICPTTPTYFFASRSQNSAVEDPLILFQRFEKRDVGDTTFTPYLFETFYLPQRIKFKRNNLEKASGVPVNTDLSPVAYLYNLKLWDQYSDSHLSGIIEFMESLTYRFWLTGFCWLLAIVITFMLLVKPSRKALFNFSSLAAVFSTGLAAMGMSITLIFSFQNLYSALFEKIGFLIALFMVGLSLGGGLLHQRIKKGSLRLSQLIAVQFVIVAAALLLPYLIKVFSTLPAGYKVLYYLIMVGVGFLTGQVFPLSAALMSREGKQDIGTSAAQVDAADHLGGSLGALLMGTFLIPILGIVNSCALIAAMEGTSLVLWLLYRLRYKT